jgi:multiple sugar transport system substrate-binding protein
MILTKFISFSYLLKRQTVLALFLLPFFCFANTVTVIDFGLSDTSGTRNKSYQIAIDDFEDKNPDIKIRFRILDGENFTDINKSLMSRLEEDSTHIDLLAWYGGKRTVELIKNDLLEPIDEFWHQHQLDQTFSAANKENVSYKGSVYGIPISYYPWGFYYSKSVFSDLNLIEPITWEGFTEILAVLKRNNITPIAIGTKEPWPAAAWFDYFILRNNSFEFYKQLMAGRVSYNSPQVMKALTMWQELIAQKYFSRSPQKLDGENLLPLIIREVAGVNLMGSFALSNVPDKFKDDLGFFAFPKIREGVKVEINEIAPLSTISILKTSKHKKQALRFIRYLSLPEIQHRINNLKTTLAPHLASIKYPNDLVRKGKNQLDSADHLSQYFDRETEVKMAKFAKQAFADFIEHGDIKRLVEQLEMQRNKVFDLKKIKITL